jgi:hypothetical protein
MFVLTSSSICQFWHYNSRKTESDMHCNEEEERYFRVVSASFDLLHSELFLRISSLAEHNKKQKFMEAQGIEPCSFRMQRTLYQCSYSPLHSYFKQLFPMHFLRVHFLFIPKTNSTVCKDGIMKLDRTHRLYLTQRRSNH